MTNISWNGGSGNWNDPSEWTPAQVPTNDDMATIAGTAAEDVSIDNITSVTVDTLTVDNSLAALEVDGYLEADIMVLQSGTVQNDGTIANTTITMDGGSLSFDRGLLSADTIKGVLALGNNNTAAVKNGLTMVGESGSGPGTISIEGLNSALLFGSDAEMLDNTTIRMGNAASSDSLNADGILSLGTGVLVQTASSFAQDIFGGSGSIINDGTILADATTGEIDVESTNFINNGAIFASGGDVVAIQPQDNFENSGTITVGNGSTVSIQNSDNFMNTGLIDIQSDGELDINSPVIAFTQSQTAGGEVSIEAGGVLDAKGGTVNIAPDTAFFIVTNGGTIENTVLALNGGGLTTNHGTYDAVTFEGNFDLNFATAFIQDGLTAVGQNGTGPGTITVEGDSVLYISDAETLSDATITMGGDGDNDGDDINVLYVTGQLTIDADAVIQTTASAFFDADLFDNGGSVLNNGAVLADASSGTMAIQIAFENYGTVSASGGDTIYFQGTVTNNDTMAAIQGSLLEIGYGQFANFGTVTATDGSLEIGSTSFTNSGQIDVSSGQLYAESGLAGGAGTVTIENGSTATFNLGVNASQHIDFGAGDNSLVLNDPSGFAASVADFAEGDSITLADFAGDTHSFANGVLTFSEGGTVTGTITFDGDYQASDFTYTTDGDDLVVGLDVLPCFAAGTRILTKHGEIAVETLREGDQVVTVTDGLRKLTSVTWIGHRVVRVARHAAPEKVRPVRVAAHAFGDTMPMRDLLLSPDHAVYAEGVLVPVKYLINGTTVRFDHTIDRVTYFHVELVQHEILLAEGLPAESYLETGGRAMFENGGLPVVLHADFSPMAWDVLGCADLKVTGDEVNAIRARLSERVKRLTTSQAVAA